MRKRLLVAGLAIVATSCIPSIKSVFVDLSYPDTPTESARRDVTLSVDSTVMPTLVGGYERPHDVGLCLAEIASDPANNVDAMWKYGDCMAKGGNRESCLPLFPWIKSASGKSTPSTAYTLRFPCKQNLGDADRLALALALDDASVAFTTYVTAAYGPSANRTGPSPEVLKGFVTSMQHAASLLRADPATHDTKLPALSLSGGAANGAFVAGFMHALLWMREQARIYGTPAQRALVDSERFGSTFGSSVGSLIGLPLDLYFTDGPVPPALAPAIDACIREGSAKSTPPERALQACGLALLEHDFVASEADLLCAQPGSALDLMTPNAKSIIRFDPLEHDRIEPFFRSFGAITRGNPFLRTIVAADLAQGVLGVLDERACLLPGVDSLACSREAILASVSEPILAPPRPVVFTGLNAPNGEPGFWLDGGLQSVNPAARAVGSTRGKVLAVNTFRALGTPVTHIEGLAPVALGTIVTIGTRLIAWETSYAGLEQHRQRAHACEVGRLVNDMSLCPGAPGPTGPVTPAAELLSVSVPDDIAPAALFASGYTFDPIVMRGLFLWGERLLLRSRAEVLGFLDWCAPLAMEKAGVKCAGAEGANPAFAAAIADLERRVSAEIDGYKKYEAPGVWKKHLEDRKDVVSHDLKTCK